MQIRGQAASVTEDFITLGVAVGPVVPLSPSRSRGTALRAFRPAIPLFLLFPKIVKDSRYAGAQIAALSLQRCH